jgi:hypothetical protein
MKLEEFQNSVIFSPVNNFFEQFSQLSQLVFGFALGLAFSHSNISVGWILFWILLYEFIVFLSIGNTKYYSLFFRVVYNSVFICSVLIGQFIYFGHTTFQDWLYPDAKSNIKTRAKPSLLNKVENLFSDTLEDEEKKIKKYRLKKKYIDSSY